MKLPDDALLDSLQFLDRASLDVVQVSAKHWHNIVRNKLAHLCLRLLKSATITRPTPKHENLFGKWELSATGPPDKSILSLEEHAGEGFALLIASSYIEELFFKHLELNDRLLGTMKPALANVHVAVLFASECDLNASVFVDTVTSFGSIRDRQEIQPYCALLSARAINAILNYAAECQTRELFLPTSYSDDPDEVIDESVLKFLTAPSKGKKIRSLEITRPSISSQFFEKLAEAHRSGQITSNVDMKLRAVNVPTSTEKDRLPFALVKSDIGVISRFREELVLTTTHDSLLVEYKGRNAGMAHDDEDVKGDE